MVLWTPQQISSLAFFTPYVSFIFEFNLSQANVIFFFQDGVGNCRVIYALVNGKCLYEDEILPSIHVNSDNCFGVWFTAGYYQYVDVPPNGLLRKVVDSTPVRTSSGLARALLSAGIPPPKPIWGFGSNCKNLNKPRVPGILYTVSLAVDVYLFCTLTIYFSRRMALVASCTTWLTA